MKKKLIKYSIQPISILQINFSEKLIIKFNQNLYNIGINHNILKKIINLLR